MAYAQITYTDPDGSTLIVVVGDEKSHYPDGIADARAEAVRCMREALVNLAVMADADTA